jgi:ribosomal protein S2
MFLLKKVLNDLVVMFSESNARLLFVGSKEQLVNVIKDSAERCGQYFVNHRWFGGTLTNWKTIQQSIRKMNILEKELADQTLDKKLRQSKERVYNKLINSLGGIRKMSNLPDIIFVTDTNREKVAIQEANKLGIPVIALLDSNSSPIGVDYPIPCNDDSQDAVSLICQLISDAVLTGIESAFERRQAQQKEREQNRKSYAERRNYANTADNKEKSAESGAQGDKSDVRKPYVKKGVSKDESAKNKNDSNN